MKTETINTENTPSITGGNWIAKKYSNDWGVYSDSGTGRDIALVREYAKEDEAKANAHLIAAAPELLEMCIATLEDLESGELEGNATEAAKGNLRAAIRKAIGK